LPHSWRANGTCRETVAAKPSESLLYELYNLTNSFVLGAEDFGIFNIMGDACMLI